MRAITVLGPSQSGKSTLIERLAGLDGGKTRRLPLMGDVSLTEFEYDGESWAALDLPGGLEAIGQAGPLLAVSDGAVLCLPAEAETAVLAAPYLRLLEGSNMPTFVFLNKVDAAPDRVSAIVAALQTYCAHGLTLRQIPMRSGDKITGAIDLISERAWQYREGQRSSLVEVPEALRPREGAARDDLLEALADFDDALLEQILEDQRPAPQDIYAIAARALQHHDLIPVFLGAASQGNGVRRLMKALRHEMPGVEALKQRDEVPPDTVAASCAGSFVRHVGKIVLLRAMADGLASSSRLGGERVGGLVEIDLKTQVAVVPAGGFAVAVKSDHLLIGAYLSEEASADLPGWTAAHAPRLSRVVAPIHERDQSKLSAALEKLRNVDPALRIGQDETSGGLTVSAQGTKHLAHIVEALEQVFGLETTCAEVAAPLRETIRGEATTHYRHRKQSGGAGQFADVVLTVRPQPTGAGFDFQTSVKGGAVPRNYIPAVAAGAQEALAKGPKGYPVVDVSVTLTDGKAHAVDSSEFAFRAAGRAAVSEALAEIGTVLLQPILRVEIHLPSLFTGDVVQLVGGLKGQVLGFEGISDVPGWDVFRALIPMAALEEALRSLGAATRGTAWLDAEFDHYEELREETALQKAI